MVARLRVTTAVVIAAVVLVVVAQGFVWHQTGNVVPSRRRSAPTRGSLQLRRRRISRIVSTRTTTTPSRRRRTDLHKAQSDDEDQSSSTNKRPRGVRSVRLPLGGEPGSADFDVAYEGDYLVHFDRGVCKYAGRYGVDVGLTDEEAEKLPVLLRFADRVVAVKPSEVSESLTLLKRGDEEASMEDAEGLSGNDSTAGGAPVDRREPDSKNSEQRDPTSRLELPRAMNLGVRRVELVQGSTGRRVYDSGSGSPVTFDGAPKLSKLSKSASWRTARNKALQASREHARELVTLSAARAARSREPCAPLTPRDVFLLDVGLGGDGLTKGQRQCLEDVEEDMCRRKKPMDRLIFGDVGFGKTELALRAVALAAKSGRQAAIVAPTSILASQHYETLKRRLEPLNISVELLLGIKPGTSAGGRKKKKKNEDDPLGDESASSSDGDDDDYKDRAAKGSMRTPPRKRHRIVYGRKDYARAKRAIASGACDVCVGTHALLGDRQTWARLGLAVIDEEQRFGVTQKERLKKACVDVDVLSLSATPIPRTLSAALSGIRDMSELPAPPPGRGRTVTRVVPDDPSGADAGDDRRLARILSAEIRRGGQCFYVVPFVNDIPRAVRRVKDALVSSGVYGPGVDVEEGLVPLPEEDDHHHDEKKHTDLVFQEEEEEEEEDSEEKKRRLKDTTPPPRVLVAHGRSADAPFAVADFAAGDNFTRPVLVATTLVENGLDLPRVNTIFVADAHRFGLATLHQLRGRVGRGDNDALCVLAYPRPSRDNYAGGESGNNNNNNNGAEYSSALTPAAAMRLRAMADERRNSGPDLAKRDLEIRGAGAILGTKQSGRAVKFVGGRLYNKALRDELSRIRALDVESCDACDLDPVLPYLGLTDSALGGQHLSDALRSRWRHGDDDDVVSERRPPPNTHAPQDDADDEDDRAFAVLLASANDLGAVAKRTRKRRERKLAVKAAFLAHHAARLGFDALEPSSVVLDGGADGRGADETDDDEDTRRSSVWLRAPRLTPETWTVLKQEVPEALRTSLRFDEPRGRVEVVRLGALPPTKRLDFLLEVVIKMTSFIDRIQHIRSDGVDSDETTSSSEETTSTEEPDGDDSTRGGSQTRSPPTRDAKKQRTTHNASSEETAVPVVA